MATHTALSAHAKPLRMSFQKDLSHLKLPPLSELDFQRTDDLCPRKRHHWWYILPVHCTCDVIEQREKPYIVPILTSISLSEL